MKVSSIKDRRSKNSINWCSAQCISEDGHINHGALYPVPGDCTKFYQCDTIGSISRLNKAFLNWYLIGIAHEFDCPQGLVFNPLIDVCDWPSNVVDCGPENSLPSGHFLDKLKRSDLCFILQSQMIFVQKWTTIKLLSLTLLLVNICGVKMVILSN